MEQFQLRFRDPTGWSKNHFEARSSNNGRLNIEVKNWESRGHPFFGQSIHYLMIIADFTPSVTIVVRTNPHALTASTSLPKHSDQQADVLAGDDMHATFEIGFDYPGPGEKHPIHENIAIAAFLNSSVVFPKATTYNNLNHKQWEYFRGMIWNDDPECLLFEKSTDDNRLFGIGADWYQKFKLGDAKCMTQRSHFGDLQFLHAMGAADGEMPHITRERMLQWMGVMYKLACGNQGVSEDQHLREHFDDSMFNRKTDPSGGTTLRDLILADRPEYRGSNIPLRALGICMHMIQDSYAMGHVQRRLLNRWDFERRDKNGYLVFRPGAWAQWGPIVSFHTYGTQDEDRHSFYDGLEGAHVPNPRDIGSFNRLLGARDAINACILLINAFARKQSWSELRPEMETRVFAIDPNAKPCNSAVDNSIPGLDFAYGEETDHAPEEPAYYSGLAEKGMFLDPEAGTQPCAAMQHQHGKVTWLRGLVLTLTILVVLLLTMWLKGCVFGNLIHI